MFIRTLFITAGLTLGLASIAAADNNNRRPRIDVPEMPAILEVPDGHEVFMEGYAIGTQNYICMPAPTGVAWKFLGPQATLFIVGRRGRVEQQIATHFLSPNPVEAGLPRATWQDSDDTSAVWAKAIATATSADYPAYVEAGAIPWLKLEVVGTATGPRHGSTFAKTTYIQRLSTTGGVAPATGCTQTGNIGVTVHVPYTTDYFFYRQR